mgnify:CR=1 FL=1
MCFSATASFTLGAVLLATGAFSTVIAAKSNTNYLFLALIPIFFGIQQNIEGIIWWQLYQNNFSTFTSFWIYLYLFFAFYFWPAYIPLCAYYLEKNPFRKKILIGFIIAGTILGSVIYGPLLLGIISAQATIAGQCIHYVVYQSTTLIWWYTISYILIVTISLLLSSAPKIKLLGMVTFIAALAAYWWYFHAFTSIWCFFSAALSIYVASIIYQLPVIAKR